jgi:hypothetical protein
MATVALSGIITPSNVVTATSTTTLTNKTLTAPTIASANLTTALTLAGAAGTNGQVLTSAGSGLPSWTTLSAGVAESDVYVTTGNGHGSTNTKIRRYTTTTKNAGTNITYADSASNGASFTINTTGVYTISIGDIKASGFFVGISLNSTQLATSIISITAANELAAMYIDGGGGGCICISAYLTATDVVRPHGDGGATGSTREQSWFRITRVG